MGDISADNFELRATQLVADAGTSIWEAIRTLGNLVPTISDSAVLASFKTAVITKVIDGKTIEEVLTAVADGMQYSAVDTVTTEHMVVSNEAVAATVAAFASTTLAAVVTGTVSEKIDAIINILTIILQDPGSFYAVYFVNNCLIATIMLMVSLTTMELVIASILIYATRSGFAANNITYNIKGRLNINTDTITLDSNITTMIINSIENETHRASISLPLVIVLDNNGTFVIDPTQGYVYLPKVPDTPFIFAVTGYSPSMTLTYYSVGDIFTFGSGYNTVHATVMAMNLYYVILKFNVPNPPTNVVATVNPITLEQQQSTIGLTWVEATPPEDTTVSNYRIYEGDRLVDTVSGSATSYTYTATRYGVYTMGVVAVANNGAVSEKIQSAPVQIFQLANPDVANSTLYKTANNTSKVVNYSRIVGVDHSIILRWAIVSGIRIDSVNRNIATVPNSVILRLYSVGADGSGTLVATTNEYTVDENPQFHSRTFTNLPYGEYFVDIQHVAKFTYNNSIVDGVYINADNIYRSAKCYTAPEITITPKSGYSRAMLNWTISDISGMSSVELYARQFTEQGETPAAYTLYTSVSGDISGTGTFNVHLRNGDQAPLQYFYIKVIGNEMSAYSTAYEVSASTNFLDIQASAGVETVTLTALASVWPVLSPTYTVYQSDAAVTPSASSVSTADGLTTLTYTINGLTGGTQYSFYVKGVHGQGEFMSDTVTVTPTTPAIPNPPTNVATSVNANDITVTWTGSSSAGVTGYTVYNGSTEVGTVSSSTTSYSLTVEQTGEYVMGVVANNSATVTSSTKATASPVTVQTINPPNPPTNVTASVNTNDITVSWTGSSSAGVTGYTVYNGSTEVGTVSFSTTTFSFTVQTKGAFTPGVVANNSTTAQSSTKATSSPVTVQYLVSSPSNIIPTANGNLVRIVWSHSTANDVSPISHYIFYNGDSIIATENDPTVRSKVFTTPIVGPITLGIVATNTANESSAKAMASLPLTVFGGIFRYSGSAVQLGFNRGHMQDTTGAGATISTQATQMFDISSTDISFSCTLPNTSGSGWNSNITYAKIGTQLFFGQLKGNNILTFGFDDGTGLSNANIGTVTYTPGDTFSVVLDKTQALFKINGAQQATFPFPSQSGSSPLWSSQRSQYARLISVGPVHSTRSLIFAGLTFIGLAAAPPPPATTLQATNTASQIVTDMSTPKQGIATLNTTAKNTENLTIRYTLVMAAATAITAQVFATSEPPTATADIVNALDETDLTSSEQKVIVDTVATQLVATAGVATMATTIRTMENINAAVTNITSSALKTATVQAALTAVMDTVTITIINATTATKVSTLADTFNTTLTAVDATQAITATAAAVGKTITALGAEAAIAGALAAANTKGITNPTLKGKIVEGILITMATNNVTNVALGTAATTAVKNTLTNTAVGITNITTLKVVAPTGSTYTLNPADSPLYLPLISGETYTVSVIGYSPSRSFSYNGVAKILTDTTMNQTYAVGDTLIFGTAPTTISATIPALGSGILEFQNNTPVPCFPTGTLIRTVAGDKPVEALSTGDYVLTADNRPVPVRIYSFNVAKATEANAPYVVPAHALGPRQPARTLHLSPHHAFQVRPNVWQIPLLAAERSTAITQYGIGEPITYYHVECPNFFRDNLVADGVVCESFGSNQTKGLKGIYRFAPALGGYTRVSGPSFAKKA